MLNPAVHRRSGPNWVNISSLRSSELLACEMPLPHCDYMNSSVTTDSWLQLSPSAAIMQYGRKVKHSATECSENESPLKEDSCRSRTPWRSWTSLYGFTARLPQADFHRTHQSSTSLLTDRFTLNFIQIRPQMWKVRVEQHDGLRQAWRSLLRFARNSSYVEPVPDCISVGRKMCNIRASVPLLQ